jgi:hypothetical protein
MDGAGWIEFMVVGHAQERLEPDIERPSNQLELPDARNKSIRRAVMDAGRNMQIDDGT